MQQRWKKSSPGHSGVPLWRFCASRESSRAAICSFRGLSLLSGRLQLKSHGSGEMLVILFCRCFFLGIFLKALLSRKKVSNAACEPGRNPALAPLLLHFCYGTTGLCPHGAHSSGLSHSSVLSVCQEATPAGWSLSRWPQQSLLMWARSVVWDGWGQEAVLGSRLFSPASCLWRTPRGPEFELVLPDCHGFGHSLRASQGSCLHVLSSLLISDALHAVCMHPIIHSTLIAQRPSEIIFIHCLPHSFAHWLSLCLLIHPVQIHWAPPPASHCADL